MLTVQTIFSDGAVFQSDAPLTIRGTGAVNSPVTGNIAGSCGVVAAGKTCTDENGRFSLTLQAPGASFEKYTVSLRCATDSHVMQDVLFGQVWLATGQSNMELPNLFHVEAQSLYDRVKTMQLRVYQVEYPPYYCKEGDFPWEPDPMMPGHWIGPEDEKELSHISAVGLMFAADLYEALNRDAQVPVAILNSSWGATFMRCWLPRAAVEQDPAVLELLDRLDAVPTPENWNTYGLENYHQTAAMYNVKIAPLEGVKVRGLLWYQGENDVNDECQRPAYAQYLLCYHRAYAQRFAADPDNFLMICSLLYPYTYGDSGECRVGYLNRAFTRMAAQHPDKFAAVPVADLSPVWCPHQGNHPVHTTHKYPLGSRMAQLALDNVYGCASDQLRPAGLRAWKAEDGRIRLVFDSVGSGLAVKGPAPVGLYVAGEDGVYLPAQCDMNGDSMTVWCDAISTPRHAAYAIQSMEPGCNLWAGKYPVLPFCTDLSADITIEARPWYDTFRTAVWTKEPWSEQPTQLFYYPIWQPEPGAQLCVDSAFTLEGQSVRVCSETPQFGCFVKSHPYNRLDLQKFARLSLQICNTDALTASLVLVWQGGQVELPLVKVQPLRGNWAVYEAVLQGIPADAEITHMRLHFDQAGQPEYYVNFEKLRLWKA